MTPELPPALSLARRTLDHIPGVRLVGDWIWNDALGLWHLYCRLHIGKASKEVATESDWYVCVSPDYPWGSIKFYPAEENGVRVTFPHQTYNTHKDASLPWRSGDLCLSTSVRVLQRSGLDTEPVEASERLRWHAERALLWLYAAASGCLTQPDEPFELPQFPLSEKLTFAFNESNDSLPLWKATDARTGKMDLAVLDRGNQIYVVQRFCSLTGMLTYKPPWGNIVNDTALPSAVGLWLRLDSVPVLAPWQAPATWGELRIACRHQDIELDNLLKTLVPYDREGRPCLLSVGFPIPALFGGAPSRMQWQTLLLPPLTKQGSTVRGFRSGEKAYWFRDRTRILKDEVPIKWIRSENWDKSEITSRGSLPKAITNRKILIIGAGALGAPIAHLLLRAGVCSLTLADAEPVDIGNLTRHTLDMDHLGRSKAFALAEELRKTSPHVFVYPICASFPNLKPEDAVRVARCDLILDCTAEDSILPALETFKWQAYRTVIFSLSLGMGAHRLFCFAAPAEKFREEDFRQAMTPWLTLQAEEYGDAELPREGIGCWHPVFPARIDDVWLLAATAVKEIERTLGRGIDKAVLSIAEQTLDEDGAFTGLRRVTTGEKV